MVWGGYRVLHLALQFLWVERDAARECDGAESDGYMSNTEHLGRQFDARMGDARLAD